MQPMNCNTWTEFKSICIDKKNLNLQYTETDTKYYIFGPDMLFLWQITLAKTSDDGIDFEDNYKDLCNFAIGSFSMPFALDNMQCAYDGIELTEIDTDVKKLYFKIEDDNLFLPGGESSGRNIGNGDWFSFSIVDHDNILGYGVDFPLKSWVKKKFLKETGCTCTTPYAGSPPKHFYLMVEYHKVASLGKDNPWIWVQFFLHKKVI